MRKSKKPHDRAARIFEQLADVERMDDNERWQHALFFAMSPQERCHFSLKTARSALSLRRSHEEKIDFICVISSKRAANRETDVAVLPILRRTLRLAKRLNTR